MKIRFLGANQQVTGSRYLLEASGLRVLVDCGLFQERPYLERNWNPFPVPPRGIDVLLLTHVHLDHSGFIPRLIREGFSRKILMTAASAELLPIVLLDSAHVQQEDAVYKKKRHKKEGRRGPHPELPLYTEEDVKKALPLVETVPYGKTISLGKNLSVCYHDAGHILGSAMLEFQAQENGQPRKIIFSGDIGQWNKPIVRDPSVFDQADVVIMESTYGDRNHEDPADTETLLTKIISEAVQAGGNVVIPTFAIERPQEIMFHLRRLIFQERIPQLLVFLDSPMATDVTKVFLHHPECLDREMLELMRSGQQPFHFPGLQLIRTPEESKAINGIKGSCIIMAGSGMCTGGRIKHHLAQNISRPESTILFVGYQADGTLGRQILEGRSEVRIFGQLHPVRARIAQIHGFSGHADKDSLLRWLHAFKTTPSMLFLSHGDKRVSQSLARHLQNEGRWDSHVPQYGEEWDFD